MKATSHEIDESLRLLEATPARLRTAALAVPLERLSHSPRPKSWSAQEILAHLRACSDLWSFSIYAMLSDSEPVLTDTDERKWAKVAGYTEIPFQTGLDRFSHERAVLLRVLRRLKLEEWERGGTIQGRRHTVFSQARRMGRHEAEHCEQVEEMLGG